MISEPVLKDLEGAKKTHKVMGIALETHQGVILGGTLVVYAVICYYLAGLFGIDPTTAGIALCWIIPVAFAFAFIKKDGKHLDHILLRKYLSFARPEVLVQTQLDPDNPTQSLRNSVQRALPADHFYWEMLGCKDGTHLIAFEVDPVGLSLFGDTERQRVYAAAIEFYNRIDFDIVEFVRSREGSTARYTRRLKDTISSSIHPGEQALKKYAASHVDYLERTVPSYNIFERRGYIILPYNPGREAPRQAQADGGAKGGIFSELLRLLGFGGRPSARDARKKQVEAEAAYRVLSGRAQTVHEAFIRMGCRIRALTELELTAFIKEQTTEWDPDDGPPINLYSPLTLEHAGYEMLSEEERQKMAHAADEVREEAPIAFAMGEISVAEKIAPDTVRIYPDFLRVEGRYHTTLYVSEWADEVYFGMMERLTHIEGRVKLVKHIKPQAKEKALKILGARLAALRAAERTADDGNVASSMQRDISRFTNEVGHRELVSDRQRYLELSCFIHVESDTQDGLAAMVDQVVSTLSQYRTQAKLCREEAWEGFLTTLPFGRDYSSRRYTKRGMLTNPLACLFSYGTNQIDHERGVFLGVDLNSAGLITINNRQLMNPHSVIIGQSGGGKTFVVKCLATRQRMLGRRIVIIDPEANSKYAKVARKIGGEFALIAPGSPHKINPFDLHDDYLNIDLLDDASMEADGEDADEAYARARAAALDGKVQEITRTVSLMLSSDSKKEEGLTGAQAGFVERAIYESYSRKGIVKDPSTHKHEPPIFPDFFAILAEYAENSPECTDLYEKLYSWHSGALSTLFDSQTNVDLANKFLVFQISKVKGRQKAPVYHSVLEFLNGVLSNPNEAAECYMDEFASILKDDMAAEFAETMYRSGRVRNCAMTAISQQPYEFFASYHGQNILALSATHMIFRHEQRQPAAATAGYYDFSEEETQGLLNLQPGEGYLVVGQTRVQLQVMASAEEEDLFNTKPSVDGAAEEPDLAPAQSGGPTHGKPPAEKRRSRAGAGEAAAMVGGGGEQGNGWRPYGTHVGAEDAGRKSALRLPPSNPDGSAAIYAFVGPGAPEVAARIARAFAAAAEEEQAFVLAVDADRGRLYERLCDESAVPPDLFLSEEETDLERLAPHVASASGYDWLKVVPAPEDPDVPAFALVKAARGIFNTCVVVCAEDSSYATDWIQEADRVVACSADASAQQALAHCLRVESQRGKNGTLLCTSSEEVSRQHAVAADGRKLYTVGGAANEKGPLELARALATPHPEDFSSSGTHSENEEARS